MSGLAKVTATSFVGALTGNADTATKATKDSAGQQINTTYIKGLSVSGTTITYTKGDGTTGTITTQDNNTTYSNFVKSGSGAKNGLVPAPSTTAGTTKYLREDCSWQVPPNTTYTAASANPKAAGTAAVGTSTKYAREDHVHPAQTSVSGSSGSCTGNAATATKLGTATKGSASQPIYLNAGAPTVCLTLRKGTGTPAASTGSDGDIYFKYTS